MQGYACIVCHFDFGATYGRAAANYIHVHHLVPLAEMAEEYEVDPEHDLIPVCPNCHAVIHLRTPPFSSGGQRNVGLEAMNAGAPSVQLTYEDSDAKPGESYYYVRVQQSDGQMAWSSPMWITTRGK